MGLTLDIHPASPVAADLGESLTWDAASARLHWIDAWASTVHATDPETGVTVSTDFSAALSGQPIGSIAAHGAGGLVAGVRGGFWHLDPDTGAARILAAVETDRPATNRLNDGKCDRAGRFWCASANTDHKTASGALWRLQHGQAPTLMQDGLIVGNGIAWSPDSRTMYLADTFAGTVWASDFDLASGQVANRRVFVSTAEISAAPGGERLHGVPDGATVDADGCYWVALFRGGAVAQFDPDGRLVRHVPLPVRDPTICAFGGAELDILYVATASRFLDTEQRRAQPLAGRVLAIQGLGARGLAEPGFHA